MLMRNYIGLAVLAVLVLTCTIIFLVLRRKASNYESRLDVLEKGKLNGKLEK